jgi:hypothetical protein
VKREAGRREEKLRGGACFCLFAAPHFAKPKKDAERRQTQGQRAVPLARQRIQRDAHACRRSTTVLAKGTLVAVWLSVRPGFLGRGFVRALPAPPVPVQGAPPVPVIVPED